MTKAATHTAQHKTTKKGTGSAQRKTVTPKVEPPDPPKPASLSYSTLDKDATHGASFRFEWKLGSAINAKAKQYHVTITTKGWESDHIVRISVPEVSVVSGQRLHRLIAPQFVGFYKAAAKKGLGSHFVSHEGAFFPRTITGNTGKLSNHALGTAVDLNGATNPYGAAPAARGKTGSLRELADFCADFGLYWGGWYAKHKDGMHFEAVSVLDETKLRAACKTHGVTYDDIQLPKPPEKPAEPAKPAKVAAKKK